MPLPYSVCKRNGRLLVIQETEVVYAPPDFLRHRIVSREQLQVVADRLNAGGDYIDVVRSFELSLRPDIANEGKSPSLPSMSDMLKVFGETR